MAKKTRGASVTAARKSARLASRSTAMAGPEALAQAKKSVWVVSISVAFLY